MKQKEIILLYEFFSEMGGLERELIAHAKFLREAGYKVKILTLHVDKSIIPLLDLEGIELISIAKSKSENEFINLATSLLLGLTKIDEYDPDAFISYSAPMNYVIRKKQNLKIDFMNHLPNFLYLPFNERLVWAKNTKGFKRSAAIVLSVLFGGLLKRIDKKLVLKNKLIFANSKHTKKKVDNAYGTDSIVSYPPLSDEFKPSTRKIKEKYVFSSGRIIPDKKYEWLIESCALMKQKIPVYISGQGNDAYKEQLLSLAKSKGVNLTFLGRLSTKDLIAYYSNATVFAFPTPDEDFGLVPAESMACGSPAVIWGDGAGPTEQVIDGVTGFHAKPYEFSDFAQKLDQAVKTNMKQKNKSKIIAASKKFTNDEVKKDFVKKIKLVVG